MHNLRTIAFVFLAFIALPFSTPSCRAQAALLMEEPYGFFGALNPTGHTAVYFERVCAETPIRLRRCQPGELGAVVSRYQGIAGYDWVAIPLIPYLYSVENASDVPERVNRATVKRLRNRYHETHLLSLGQNLPPGNFLHGGWTQLVGVSYERRIFALRFETSEAQDDAFIAKMNASENRTDFNLLFNNCSDFARRSLNFYFPGTFNRSIFPDAGMTTPKQITFKLARYAKRHPEMRLTVFEVAQIPGYRRLSRSNKSIAESLTTTGYAIPIVVLNPYLAGGLFVDYIVRGRYHSIPKHPQLLSPGNLTALTAPPRGEENPGGAGEQTAGVSAGGSAEIGEPGADNSGLTEIKDTHE